ncbi:WD domain, G-beta repeat [Carpediemonas membranifera]|uniref:WD domain, G-beta repeat n=1 Tax=Carpediemonas membranifera TaxID=201153 RepID=A0A8J6ARL9_9EUKA|nr:WD domain, G-beta repeat [Carpediemonas membranifera]|eukprot:KAG9389670.1 WD domain, G-beta repeat [Carpediemonas membranifera]
MASNQTRKRKAAAANDESFARNIVWDASRSDFSGPWGRFDDTSKWEKASKGADEDIASIIGPAILPRWYFEQQLSSGWHPRAKATQKATEIVPSHAWSFHRALPLPTTFPLPSKLRQTIRVDKSGVGTIAASPAGLVACGRVDGDVSVYSLPESATGSYSEEAVLKGHTEAINALCWPGGAGSLISGSHDGTLKLWDLERNHATTSPLRDVQGMDAFDSIKFYPTSLAPQPGQPAIVYASVGVSGSGLASARSRVVRWDTRMAAPEMLPCGLFDRNVNAISFSEDGRYYVTGDDTNRVMLFSVTAPTMAVDVLGTSSRFPKSAICRVGSDRWAVSTRSHHIQMIDFKDGRIKFMTSRVDGKETNFSLRGGGFTTGQTIGLDASPDGRYVVSGSGKGGVFLWKVDSNREQFMTTDPVKILRHGDEAVSGVSWSPLGGVWSCGADGRVKLWR